MDPVVFFPKITNSMCEWLNENLVVHNTSQRMIGFETLMSIQMSKQNMIYFKLKWSDDILTEEEIRILQWEQRNYINP